MSVQAEESAQPGRTPGTDGHGPSGQPAATEGPSQHRLNARLQRHLQRSGVLIAFVVMIAIFWVDNPSAFGTWSNAESILDEASVILILGAGLTLVLAAGEFDASFPGVILLSGVIVAKLLNSGTSPLVASLVGIGVSVAALSLAGVLVAMQRTSSLIVTLALMTLWTGVAEGMSQNGVPIPINSSAFDGLALDKVFGLTLAVYVSLAVVVVFGVLLRFTVFGRRAEAIGTNPVAARFAGIPLTRVRIMSYALLGVCAGIASVILCYRQGQFTTDLSLGLFIPPFVAAFFGISVLAAGKFNMLGTVVGALFIGTLEEGLILVGAAAWTGDVVVGAALIIVLFTAAQKRIGRA